MLVRAGLAVMFLFAGPAIGARAQDMSPAEEARAIEYGKEVFKNKAICQFCHKWDASGDQGYGGNALSLRISQLTREQMAEIIKCGRPATNMPYHDRFSYTDKRCYGMDRAMAGGDMPPGANNEYLAPRDIDAVVRYLFARVVGKGPSTYEDCIDFWGKDTRQCDAMRK